LEVEWWRVRVAVRLLRVVVEVIFGVDDVTASNVPLENLGDRLQKMYDVVHYNDRRVRFVLCSHIGSVGASGKTSHVSDKAWVSVKDGSHLPDSIDSVNGNPSLSYHSSHRYWRDRRLSL
jgi:hypothetical protein